MKKTLSRDKASSVMIIERKSTYADRLRNYSVMLEHREIGKIADGETKSFEVSPGDHSLYLKIDWGRSRIVDFKADHKRPVSFVCSSSATGWKLLLAVLYATILHNRCIKLERDDAS